MPGIRSIPILITLLAVSAFAQQPQCPKLKLGVPQGIVRPGGNVEVKVVGADGRELQAGKVNWTTSHGTITDGNGAANARIQFSRDEESATVTVTAEITEVGQGCDVALSDSFEVYRGGDPVMLDAFSILPFNELKARFDNAYIYVNKNPGNQLVVIMSFPRSAKRSYKIGRLNRVLRVLRERRYDPGRASFFFPTNSEGTRMYGEPSGVDISAFGEGVEMIKGADLAQRLKTLFK